MAYGAFSLLLFAFTFYCLLDVVLTDDTQIRNLPKLAWVLLVALVWGIGGLVWLFAGRPQRASAAPGGVNGGGGTRPVPGPPRGPRSGPPSRGPGPAGPPPSGPRGPDDDPEFLRRLEERLRRDEDS